MAKKKAEPTGRVEADAPAGRVPVRLDLDTSDHRRLRIAAAEAGLPMAECVRRCVLEMLDARDAAAAQGQR